MKTNFLIILIILIFNSCKEKEPNDAPPNSGTWQLSFIVSDTLGNNLLPYPLPSNPIRIPSDYKAKLLDSSNTFSYYFGYTQKYGYSFKFYDLIKNLRKSGESYVYMIDPKTNEEQYNTIFSVELCFKNQCDTLKFCTDLTKLNQEHKNINFYLADWIIHNNDTIFNVSTQRFPLKIK